MLRKHLVLVVAELGVVSSGSSFFLKRNFYLCLALYMFSIVGSNNQFLLVYIVLKKIVALKKVLYMLLGTCRSWGSIQYFGLRITWSASHLYVLSPQILNPTTSQDLTSLQLFSFRVLFVGIWGSKNKNFYHINQDYCSYRSRDYH